MAMQERRKKLLKQKLFTENLKVKKLLINSIGEIILIKSVPALLLQNL